MATTDPLRQAGPPPQCDRVNVFTGVVLAMEEAANQKDAKQNAFDAAKERASKKDGLPDDREKKCPDKCAGGAGGGHNDPQGDDETRWFIEDDIRKVFVGFAVAHWRSTRSCKKAEKASAAEPDLPLPKPPVIKALVYQETVEPKLGKSVLYAGAAVGIAQHPNNEGKAMDAAREVAVKEANERYKKYRGKTCGNNIVPESIVGREVTVNDAKIVLSTQVLQAKHKPYVAYAFVCWSVRINCPPED